MNQIKINGRYLNSIYGNSEKIIIIIAIIFVVQALAMIVIIPMLPPNPNPPDGIAAESYPIIDDPYLCTIYGGNWDEQINECHPMNMQTCEEFNGLKLDCMECKQGNACPDSCVPGCFLTWQSVKYHTP